MRLKSLFKTLWRAFSLNFPVTIHHRYSSSNQNGYDYYYYIFEVFSGLTLCSVDSDMVDDEGWAVTNLEWPEQFRINSPQEFQSFLQAVGYQKQA